ncbi:MAG: hypothetical protein AAF641_12550 [Pseudomonadota bacterium]
MNTDEPLESKSGEILQEDEAEQSAPPGSGDSYIALLISQYTERPDLLIDAMEHHSPGFVKKFNEKAQERADNSADARFRFGQIQAYTGLGVSVVAAFATLGMAVYAIVYRDDVLLSLLALGLFYAITQGGRTGFSDLTRAIAHWIGSKSEKDDQ